MCRRATESAPPESATTIFEPTSAGNVDRKCRSKSSRVIVTAYRLMSRLSFAQSDRPARSACFHPRPSGVPGVPDRHPGHPSDARAARSRERKTKRLQPRCSCDRRPPSRVENRSRSALPEGCPAAPLCGGLPGGGRSLGHNGVPRTPRRAGSHWFFDRLRGRHGETRKALPVERAVSDFFREGSLSQRAGEKRRRGQLPGMATG